MRKIIFRGKRLDNNKWIYGSLMQDGATCSIIEDKGYGREIKQVRPETVGQYANVDDSAGNKMFEGDILIVDFKNGLRFPYEYVAFINGRFVAVDSAREYRHEALCVFNHAYEVVGNIHDNPELLKDVKWTNDRIANN